MHHRNRLLSVVCLFCWLAARTAEAAPTGQELYQLKCAKCHKLRDPADYDDETWAHWKQKMTKKARLNDEQGGLIWGYLDSLRRK